jgi:CheY-like chemotaxis protein
MLFAGLGYEVLTANNAADALNTLRRQPDIGLLFTDVVMPNGMNGIQLARTVRKQFPQTKIVIASGYPLPALTAQHGALDEFTFMNKPYRLAELAKKLRQAH